MKDSQDFNRPRPIFVGDSKQHEVPPSSVAACNVKSEQTLRDLGSLLDADCRRPIAQCVKRGGYRVLVDASLFVAKAVESPSDDVPEIRLGSSSEANSPEPPFYRQPPLR